MKLYDSRGVMKTLKANFAEMSTTAQAVADTDLITYSQVISGVNRTQNIAKSTLVTGGGGVSFTDSAGLRSNISDPTGTGKAVFYNSPNFLNTINVYGDLAATDFGEIGIYNDNGYVLMSLYGSLFSVAALRDTFFFNAASTITGGIRFYAESTSAPITFEVGSVGNAIARIQYAAPHVTVNGILKCINGDGTNHKGILLTSSVTDATTKRGGLRGVHYDITEEEIAWAHYVSGSTTSLVMLGDSTGDANGVTDIYFALAPNNTTLGAASHLLCRINKFGFRIETGGVTAAADTACLIDLASTTQGHGFPVMTTTQKNLVPAREGNAVWDSTLHKLCVYAAAAWQTVTSV